MKEVGSTFRVRADASLTLNEFAHAAAALNLYTAIKSGGDGTESEVEKYQRVLRTAIGNNPRFVPERVIKHANPKIVKSMSSGEYRAYRTALAADASYDPRGFGSELKSGNEWMFMLPGEAGKTPYIPDAVVMSDRANDGSTMHVAIEVELTAKSKQRYLEKYRAYKADTFFAHIVFMTPDRELADFIKALDKSENIGLQAAGKLTVLRYPFDTANLPSPYSMAEKLPSQA